MNSVKLEVENIKCGGCAGGIKAALMKDKMIDDVSVDIDGGLVEIKYKDGFDVETAKNTLAGMGYQEKGALKGIRAGAAKAKSFVSCAIGKFSAEKDV